MQREKEVTRAKLATIKASFVRLTTIKDANERGYAFEAFERMSKVVNEHYVPRGYLKRFSDTDEKIFVYDKFTKNKFQTNIKNVASERYFYDFPPEIAVNEEEIQWVEKSFSQIEGTLIKTINELLEGLKFTRNKKKPLERKHIYKKTKIEIGLYITFQMYRTKEFREMFLETYKKVTEALLQKKIKLLKAHDQLPEDYGFDKAQIEFNKKLIIPLEHAKLIFDLRTINMYVNAYSQFIWVLGLNRTEKKFFTSDNPVVKKANIKDTFYSFFGDLSPGIEIAFPLSPEVILVLYERSYFKEKITPNMDGKIIEIKNDDVVNTYNSLQVIQSFRQVYSIDSDFSFADEVCKRYPESCKKKERIKIN